MRLGLLLGTQTRLDPRALWEANLLQAEVADAVGFVSVHVPEHHGRSDNYLPQPLVACAAIAARTTNVLIGPTVMIPGLRHPVHVAEEAAMIDVLSGGRLMLGLGLGNFQPEFDTFGLNIGAQVELLEDHLHVLTHAWDGTPLTYHSRHFQLDNVVVTPAPVQRPMPVWVGTMSRPGCDRAARFGTGLILDPLSTIEELIPLGDYYRERCAHYGTRPHLILLRWGWLADSTQSIDEHWWPAVREICWIYSKEIPRFALPSGGSGQVNRMQDLQLSTYAPDRLLIGAPSDWLEKVAQWGSRLGVDNVVVRLSPPDSPMPEEVTSVIEAVGSLVIPSLA